MNRNASFHTVPISQHRQLTVPRLSGHAQSQCRQLFQINSFIQCTAAKLHAPIITDMPNNITFN